MTARYTDSDEATSATLVVSVSLSLTEADDIRNLRGLTRILGPATVTFDDGQRSTTVEDVEGVVATVMLRRSEPTEDVR